MQAIGAGYGAYLPPPTYHNRSVSLNPPQALPTRGSVSKAKSTTALRASTMTDTEQEGSFHTLQDPRTTSTSDLSRRASTDSRQVGADVDMEVTALSDKLIKAINHQQTLDDSLAHARHELEVARKRIEELEAREQEQERRLGNGELLRKVSVDRMNEKFKVELAGAKKEMSAAQSEKRGIEAELENLTASLFEEANEMVAKANMERDAMEKKNQQLRDQVKDEEAVIASQTEQLSELKILMQQIQGDYRKELLDSPRAPSGPSSPKVDNEESNINRLLEAMDLEPVSAGHGILPSPSTKLTHLIRSECRTDIPAFEDFRSMVQSTNPRSHNPSHASSRAGSGSYGGLNVMGLGSIHNNGNSGNSNSSNPNLGAQTTSKLANSPQVPGSFSPSTEAKGPASLKDTKFFKRIMIEDVEPTLRLDLSPSISWLSRRSIVSAFGDGTLIVEPIPESSLKLYGKYTPCSLCGDGRRDDQNPRTHAMRVREGEGATKWPICVLCLEKVRAVGDLFGYLRMVRDGVVKCGDQREEEEAWDELVRLRERLFWARMAGGVVPAFLPSTKNSPMIEDSERRSSQQPSQSEAASEFVTPSHTPRTSQEGDDEAAKQVSALQLEAGMDDALTTFDNAKERAKKRLSMQSAGNSTPPNTPPVRNRESGGFPKLSIPKIPESFWQTQVNTLH